MKKLALITGAAGGIGKALVDIYAKDGYEVVALDLPSLASELPTQWFFVPVDLYKFAQEKSLQTWVRDTVLSKYGEEELVDLVIVNNAAAQALSPIGDIPYDIWSRSLAINSFAPLKMIEVFLPQLERVQGRVVNISSIHARLTKANFAVYAASKSALESLTRSCALELSSRGISVNAVAPAAIATEMLKAGFYQDPAAFVDLERHHPVGRVGTPEELSRFVKTLTDGNFGFLTGAVLEFSGGIAGKLHDPG